MRVAVVQSGGCDEQDLAGNVERLAELAREAAASGADLVVLPELSTTPYFAGVTYDAAYRSWAQPVPGPTTERLAQVCREVGSAIAFGMLELGDDGLLYNSLVFLDRSGALVPGTLPDGRQVPAFRKLTAPTVASETLTVDEGAYCAPGPGPMVFDVDGTRYGALICYDRAFSEPWLANRAGVEECGGRATDYFGRSCVIAPDGEVLAEAKPHTHPEVLHAELDLVRLDTARSQWPVWTDRRPELYRFMYEH